MSKHSLSIENDHIILLEGNGRFIVDTGSPFSGALEETELCIGGKTIHLGTDLASTIQNTNDSILLPQKNDGILGMDVLCGNRWQFDFASRQILVNEESDLSYANSIPLNDTKCCLLIDTQVNGNTCKTILDTGACISYISPDIVNGIPSCGEIEDWNPEIGKIQTTQHAVDVVLGKKNFRIRMGKMTPILAMPLSLLNVKCILGITMLGLDSCRLDLQNNKFEF